MSISALTWAAAQDNIAVYELIRGLSPTDEARIEAAYAEWRRRAAAGERRHKVDWRLFPLLDEPVSAAPVSAEDAIDADEAAEAAEAMETDPDVAYAMEQILSVEETEPEYISLDDFNLEPSEAEMREMEKALGATLKAEAEDAVQHIPDEEKAEEAEAEAVPVQHIPEGEEADEEAEPASAGEDEPEHTEVATSPEKAEVEAVAAGEAEADEVAPAVDAPVPAEEEAAPALTEAKAEPVAVAADDAPIEQRISKLGKDATQSAYANLLSALGNDVSMAKAVTEAVIRDHTRRHRGTAAQRAFLAWLEKQ